jgi:hypothetical protein
MVTQPFTFVSAFGVKNGLHGFVTRTARQPSVCDDNKRTMTTSHSRRDCMRRVEVSRALLPEHRGSAVLAEPMRRGDDRREQRRMPPSAGLRPRNSAPAAVTGSMSEYRPGEGNSPRRVFRWLTADERRASMISKESDRRRPAATPCRYKAPRLCSTECDPLRPQSPNHLASTAAPTLMLGAQLTVRAAAS